MNVMDMAQLLGNFGEFIGAIAVVVSLIYIAIQVRRNTQQLANNEKTMLRTESSTAHEQWSNWRRMLITHPEVIKVRQKGMQDYASLDAHEEEQFYWMTSEMFYVINNMWERNEAGLAAVGLWDMNLKRANEFRDSPGGSEWWDMHKDRFPELFVASLDAGRSSQP